MEVIQGNFFLKKLKINKVVLSAQNICSSFEQFEKQFVKR